MKPFNPTDWFWIVGGDESRYWSSVAGDYVTLPPGENGASRIASEAELDEVLAQYDLPGPTRPPRRRMVPKSLVTQRVIDAGKIDQAMAMLQMDWAKFARWVAPDQPAVHFDDPDTVAMVEALELDPEVVMAPE